MSNTVETFKKLPRYARRGLLKTRAIIDRYQSCVLSARYWETCAKAFNVVNHTVLIGHVWMFTTIDVVILVISVSAQSVWLIQGQTIGAVWNNNGILPVLCLGPLLFIVVMNYLAMSTKTVSNLDMYADDSTVSAYRKDVQEIEQTINNDLQDNSNWCDENKMVIDVEKRRSCSSRPGKSTWQLIDKTDINACLKGDKLQMVESERLLRLHLDKFHT